MIEVRTTAKQQKVVDYGFLFTVAIILIYLAMLWMDTRDAALLSECIETATTDNARELCRELFAN